MDIQRRQHWAINNLLKSKSSVAGKSGNSFDPKIIDELIDFFHNHPFPKDKEEFHKWCKSKSYNPEDIEEYGYAISSTILTGGRSNNKKFTPNKKELAIGKKVEMEHLELKNMKNNAMIRRIQEILAEKIASDHLAEFPDYYTRLKKMEKQAKG